MGADGTAKIGGVGLDKFGLSLPLPLQPNQGNHDCHVDHPCSLKLMLINGRSIKKTKITFIHDLILDEEVDLACIT